MWIILILLAFSMAKELRLTISSTFKPLLTNQYRYLNLVGGKGSGKSEFVARKMLYRCWVEGNHKFLVLRKVRATTYDSVIEVWQKMLDEQKVKYSYRKFDRTISFRNSNRQKNIIKFDGLDDPEKIESIKGITGIHMEELTEFTSKDFRIVDLALREQLSDYEQIIGTYNPDEGEAEWIKNKFFLNDKIKTGPGKMEDSYIHHSTIADNPIADIRNSYRRILDRLEDEVYISIYKHGQWAVPKEKIYNWDIVDLPDIKFDEIFYGGDFGYSINPAAFIKIYHKANEYWVKELIYETGLTNIALGEKIKGLKEVNLLDPQYWDSAEPKSIQELYEMGINALPSDKGPDSVKHGIDFLKEQIIHIVSGSENIKKERNKYKMRQDKNGNILNKPVEYMNHAMDAIRYGICTHSHNNVEPFVIIGG